MTDTTTPVPHSRLLLVADLVRQDAGGWKALLAERDPEMYTAFTSLDDDTQAAIIHEAITGLPPDLIDRMITEAKRRRR
jgi:hypothetical protein